MSLSKKVATWGGSLKSEIEGAVLSRVTKPSEFPNDFEWGSFVKRGPSGKITFKSGIALCFSPTNAKEQLNIEEKEDTVLINHKGGESGVIPLLFVTLSNDDLNFTVDFYPYDCEFVMGKYKGGNWNKPMWDHQHPYFFEQITTLFEFVYTQNLKDFLSPYPLYEKFAGDEDYFMPRGIFYSTYKMRSLSFRGTGEIKYVSLANYTSEPVTYKWLVPASWKNKIGWLEGGKLLHELTIPPNSDIGMFEFLVLIDPEIKNVADFVPTLLVAQGPNRIEWLPIPLLPNREDGNFSLDPKEANPTLK
ncbi:MAG TPA: hypothetical protein ENN60_01545 [archaeon]|nr:hypothetical protein [archaeon]